MATTNNQEVIADKPVITPQTPSQPARSQTVTAVSTREYIAGGQRQQVLPHPAEAYRHIDDLTRDFGSDFYDRMEHDPVVSSCIETIKGAVFETGVNLLPAVGKDDPRYDKACKIRDRCQKAIDGLQKPLTTTLRDMASYISKGNRVAEIVYKTQNRPKSYSLTFDRIKVKPREAVSIVVDAFNNVIGFRGLEPGKWRTLGVGQWLSSTEVEGLLPRDKFALLTFREQDEDPRGKSILRAAYTPWWSKQQTIPEMMRYMAIVATPTAIGTYKPAEADVVVLGPDNKPITGTDGYPIRVSPAQSMADSLHNLQGGTYQAIPEGADIKWLQALTGGDAIFHNAIDLFDQQIVRAILLQTLSTMEGKHMSRAASDNHVDIGGLLTQAIKEDIEALVRFDLLRPLVRMNEGDDATELTPIVSLSETEQHDFPVEAAAIGSLFKDGYLDPSQLPELDARLNLPRRSEQELAARSERALMPPIDPNAKDTDETDDEGDEPPKKDADDKDDEK